MSNSTISVDLSRREIEYLRTAGFLAQEELALLNSANWKSHFNAVVILTRDMAEKLRESCSERLAKVGFDVNYEQTPEGRLLEELIDRFYVDR